MSLLEKLPHTVSHLRKTYARDQYIGNTTDTEELATSVRCWIQTVGQSEVQQYEKADQLITHKMYYKTQPTLRPGDLIRVTAGPSYVGKDFNFESLADASAGLGKLFKVMVNEENNVPVTFAG